MSKWSRRLLYLLTTALGFFILLNSFYSASKAALADTYLVKSRRFYVQREILPDHSLYPLLMAADKFRLSVADRDRRVYLLAAYANRRLFYAQQLLKKEELALAVTTLTKAEKYLLQALNELQSMRLRDGHQQQYYQLAFFVLDSVDQHLTAINNDFVELSEEQRAAVANLSDQIKTLADTLSQ